MKPIVLQSNWRGAMAVALSCKYWYKEFREKIVHPMISYSAEDEWFMLRRGQIYTNVSGKTVWDSEFNTIESIIVLKEMYHAVLKDEEQIKRLRDSPETSPAILKIRHNGEESLIARDTEENSVRISLMRSFLHFDVQPEKVCPLDERPGNVIKIDIAHSVSPSITLSIYADIWGNVQYSYVRCRAAARTTFNLKRDPKLFFDLKEILVYTKHAKSVVFPKEQKDEDHRSFRATYASTEVKKTYQIQHLIVTKQYKEEVTAVVTNDYKKDAIAKIIRLLTETLAGTLDRYEMNVWVQTSTASIASPWNPLIILPIKLRSSLKDENISCLKSLHIGGQTSKTARLRIFNLDLHFDGTMSLEIYSRSAKNKTVTAYQKETRLPDIKKVQQFLNDFEVIEKVRNNRDNTEKLERNMTAKRRAKINEGKVTQLCHPLTEPFCGAPLVSVRYRPLYLKDSYYSNHLSPRGFEFLWKCLMEFVKEANILPG
jgi:hypothetical protein